MFMLAESFSDLRFHTFRDLTLDFSEDGIEVKSHDILINQLGRVLRKAIRLERLEIWEPEKYFEFSPETHGILANLPMLTSLELSGVGEISLEVLKTVVSPIRSLNVGDTGEEREWLQELPPLPSVAATLAELSLAFINISPNQVVYPHVRSISFEHLLAPDMPAFFVAFPNLSNLHISSEDYPLEAWEAVGHRKARRNIINSLPSQWASLKCLSGDLVFLYLIGLTCRVDQLLVTVVDIESLPWFLELLDDHHPKSIFVRLDCNKLTMTSLEDTILRPMFDRPSVSRCRSLHLDLSGLSDYNASPDAFPEISDIVVCLSVSSLPRDAFSDEYAGPNCDLLGESISAGPNPCSRAIPTEDATCVGSVGPALIRIESSGRPTVTSICGSSDRKC